MLMTDDNNINDVLNCGADLKDCIQSYLHEKDLSDTPLNVLSIDSPYVDIEDIPMGIPLDDAYQYKALHINIHSIPDKIDKLKEMLVKFHDVKIDFDFILLCETFLKDNITNLYNIPGFNLVSKNRQVLTKGGVAIYIKENIGYKLRDDLSLFYEGEFETVFIQTTDRHVIVGDIYRIPNSLVLVQ
jgi:hypothetical protein